MALEQILGNETIKALLLHSQATGRVSHAYILEGSKGIGKLTLAKAFAGLLLGTESPDTHPDFMVVTNQRFDPAKKQETVLVDTIRQMKKDIYVRPYAGDNKVYVIPKADTMQAPAQNSLLKVFEEPPPYCTILLLAENANSFLPTVLSRAVRLRMQPVSNETVMEYLIRQKGLEKSKAASIAAMSAGCIGKALALLEDDSALALRDALFAKVFALGQGGHQVLYDLIRFFKQHRSESATLLELLLSFGQDVMHLKLGGSIVNADKTEDMQAFCARLPRTSAARFSEITMQYQRMLAQNVNYPIAVTCMATEYWEEIHDRNHRR